MLVFVISLFLYSVYTCVPTMEPTSNKSGSIFLHIYILVKCIQEHKERAESYDDSKN